MLECAGIRRMDACACVEAASWNSNFFCRWITKGGKKLISYKRKNAFWYEMGRLLGDYATQCDKACANERIDHIFGVNWILDGKIEEYNTNMHDNWCKMENSTHSIQVDIQEAIDWQISEKNNQH